MYFKRIDLQGFKSFADPVSIEFHEGITCIVGPNGSGKSNISDALRWVLGEQSPKMLRGGKMEEVIFAGTANRKSRGMAEVTLVIDNTTGILPIDYSEVAITRRMYRSGQSEYAINNTSCRLKDIRELIMDTGIGVDGYSIIGQGKISEIVSNKPESRREIFEEAAGIVKYRSRKEEAEKKLENSTANLDRVEDIIGEIEGRIDGLAEDSRKAKEFLELRERQKGIEINITLKNIEQVELKNEFLKDELTELTLEIDSFKDRKAAVEEDIAENRNQHSLLDQEETAVRDRLMFQAQELSRIENQAELNKERISAIERDKVRLTDEIAALKEKCALEEHNAAQMAETKEEMNRQVEAMKEALEEILEEQRDQNQAVSHMSRQVEEQRNLIYSLSAEMSSFRSEINSLESLKSNFTRRKELLLLEQEGAAEGSGKLASEKTAVEERILKCREDQKVLADQGGRLRLEQKQKKAEEEALRGELEELRISIGQAQGKLRMYQDLENSYEGYNGAVKFLMKQDLPGLEGLVAELIQVPKELATAVETALGQALQNVVCIDDQSAQRAVASLKKAKAGRLTFLPVKSIRGGRAAQAQNLETMNGYRGLAVDCVEFDRRYQNVMEYLLGRVVIVDNLDNAVTMSKKGGSGLRFVTLEGEVINASGAITGGMYKTNTTNLLSRKAEIQQLSDDLERMNQKKIDGTAQMEQLRKDVRILEDQLAALEQQYRGGQLDLMELEKKFHILSSQMDDMETSGVKRDKELESLLREETSAEVMINDLKAKLEEQTKKSLEAERILSEWIPQLEEDRRLAENLNQEVTDRRMEINTLGNRRDSASDMEQRILASIRELQKDQNDRLEQIESLTQERLELMSGDGGLLQEKDTLIQEKAASEQRLAEVQKQKADISAYLAQEERRRDEMADQLNEQARKKFEAELKLEKNENQISGWKDKLWEDFEISYIQAMEFESEDFNMSQAQKESRELRSKIKALGDVNVGAIKEYETTKERYEFLTAQRDDLVEAMNALKTIIEDMDKTIRQNFKESFDKIMVNFESTFKQLFGGGTAQLRLEDENHPLESGIEIVAQPPGKKLQNINLMSGGEKTMTAIALMFAVLKAKPTPFCILDEVEAALDEANIDRFAKYLQNFREIQFALVTHQKATMEYADVLYGVTMPEQGISKVLSLRMGDNFEI